jgi:SAM-dependent methyltransferase
MYKGIEEVRRVLKPGGIAIIMLYHKYSFVGYMLWFRYALLAFKPFTSLKTIYYKYLESEGTQAFSRKEIKDFFKNFKSFEYDINLSHGDLLSSNAGQRHEGILLNIARFFWPRFIIKKYFKQHGLFFKIRAIK